MNYLKYTQYIYLVFGILFIYVGFTKIGTSESPWLNFIIAAVAIFMFFFRRKFAKKFDQNTNK